jgi:excisionase family DNA binding protein
VAFCFYGVGDRRKLWTVKPTTHAIHKRNILRLRPSTLAKEVYMINQEMESQKIRQPKPRQSETSPQDLLIPERIYDRDGAAAACGVSRTTIERAFYSGHLAGYRTGRHIKHSGKQLYDWLEAGGKTGRRNIKQPKKKAA